MAKGFQLTAELNLRGPSNIRQVVGGIRKQLQGVNTSLNININKKNIQGISQANSRLAAINKTLQTTTKNAKNATTAFNKLSTSMRNVANVKIPNNISSGMTAATKSIQTSTKAVRQAKNEFEEFGKLGGLAIKRFAAFSVVTGAIYSVNNAIANGVKQFLEYDRQLTRVSQVLNTSRDSLKGLDKSITALSTSLGVSSSELANVTVTLSQAGIQAADTRKALEALAKSALAPTFSSLTNTTEGAIAAMRQFSITAGQLEGALGSINAVAGSFAVEAGDIITAIQRTGGVFASASKGVSQGTDALNEFIAVFTSVRATSRESAETIATGLRTIFTRLQRRDTIESLKAFGVTLTDLEGKFVGPYKAIQLLSEGLRSLDTRDLRFAGIAEELGGFRQIGKVLPLIQQFGTAQNALNVAQQGSGSLARDAAKGQLALAVQIQKVREEFTALVRSISDSTGFRNLLSLGLDLATVFVRVADSLKGLLPLIAGLGAVKGLSALAGFTKGFGGVFKADGGYIHKFARGGVVPGTGSGDTVPAMLQPGEFVVRKKAVESIGTQRLHKMNKFAKGGRVGKVKNLGAHDGDSWNIIYEPADDPVGSITTRAVGYDAYELSGGKKWENKLGAIATKMADAHYQKNQKLVGSGSFLQSFQGDKVRGKQSVGSRPKHQVSKTLVDSMVEAGVANRVTRGNNATGSTDKPSVKQIATLKANGFNYNPKTGRTKEISKKNTKALGGYIQAFASGGSVGDTVPAMLTPGEFVINKKSASQIGSRALHSLNRADKIKGYNSGGFVGFKNGGGVPARPGTTMGTIGITQADVGMLDEIGNAIKELGISSSSSADLIAQGSQASYEAAIQALEADKMRADAIGANTDAIDASIKSLQNQGKKVLKVSQALEKSSGGDLEKLSGRLNRGQDADKASKSLRTKEGGALNNLIRSGEADAASIKEYIAGARRDRKTLNEMDSRYVNQRKRHLSALGSSDEEASKLAEQEVRLRKKAVDDNAKSIGAKGPGDFGRRLGDLANKSGFAIAALGSFAGSINEASNASQAAFGAAVSGGATAFGAGQIATGAIVDLLPTDQLKNFGAGIGLAASAALGITQAFISATNAAREFKIDEAFKNSEQSMEDVNKSFERLSKDISNLNIKAAIESKLIQAGDSLARAMEIQEKEAKLGFANLFDVLASGNNQEAVQRSQILFAKDFFTYLRASFDEQFRINEARNIAMANAEQSAKRFAPVADAINKLIESRVKDEGQTTGDIVGSASFNKFAKSLVYADAQLNRMIASIMANTNVSLAEREARVENIIAIKGEEKIRTQVAIAQRQKEIEALQQSTNIYVRSLERLYSNMEQSIGAANAALSNMNRQIDLTTASLQGQAKIGDVVLNALAVLQNPRAFSAAENTRATTAASTIFGDSSMEIAGLMNIGSTLENSVMASLNDALAAGETDANVVGQKLSQSVTTALGSVGLPADLADKISKEANIAITDAMKKAGADGVTGIDFNALTEKLTGLNGVIESSKKAREVAIKALEAYNSALNNYTKNINKIIDIEVSSRNYARKAVDLLANSEIDLAKALGKTISVIDIINNREGQISRQTGGPTSPTDIFNNINRLEGERRQRQSTVDTTAQIAGRETDQFIKFNNELKNTTIGLRENISALKDMANNTDVASAALNKIQEAQQTNAQKIGFFEKVVTSTPEELENMQRSFVRLQNNINGNVNTINNSMGAQKAYHEALRSGASGFDAMRAAQAAFAKERGDTLGLMKDILPFLGDSEQTGGIRANVLESMLRESGIGVNPMMQQVLNSLRNPATDPAVAAAIQQYQTANNLQAEANRLLGRLESNLASDLAAQNEQGLKNALTSITAQFESTQLDDINKNINTIIQIMQAEKENEDAGAFARGGVVYAAGGQQIFKPKGTDTVPAMLTPGEFVVNKKSAQANLPLLKSINTGYYAAGGLIKSNFVGRDINASNRVGMTEDLVNKGAIDTLINYLKNSQSFYSLGNMYTSESSQAPGKTLKNNASVLYPQQPGDIPQHDDVARQHDASHLAMTAGTRHVGVGPVFDLSSAYRDGSGTVITFPEVDQGTRATEMAKQWKSSFPSHIINQQIDYAKKPLNMQREKVDAYSESIAALIAEMGGKSIEEVSSSLFIPGDLQSLAAPVTMKARHRSNASSDKIIGLHHSQPVSSYDDSYDWDGFRKWESDHSSFLQNVTIDALSSNRPEYPNDGVNWLRDNVYKKAANPKSELVNTDSDNAYMGDRLKSLLSLHDLAYKAMSDPAQGILSKWDLGAVDPATGVPAGISIRSGEQPNSIFQKLMSLYKKEIQLVQFNAAETGRIGKDIGGKNLTSLMLADNGSIFSKMIKEKATILQQLNDAGSGRPPGLENAIFGVKGLLDSEAVSSELFDIDPGRRKKEYSWAANVTAQNLGKQFQSEIDKQQNKSSDGTNQIKLLDPEFIKAKFKLPENNALGLNSLGVDIPVQYEEYSGKFYDGQIDSFKGSAKGFLPFVGENLFKNVDDSLTRIALKDKLDLPDLLTAIGNKDKFLENLYGYYSTMFGGENDDTFKNKLMDTTMSLGPVWTKFFGAGSPVPRFTGLGPGKHTFSIGEQIIAQVKALAEGAGADGDKIDTKSSIFQNANLEDSLIPTATKSLTKSALEIFQRKQFTRGLSGFLGRNLGRIPRLDIEDSNEAKGIAGFVSNVFSTVGGYADSAFNQAPNGRVAQFIKDAYILASGAWQAFGGIRDGDTKLLNDFNTAANAKGEIPKAYAEGLFRSLGGGAALARIMDFSLPGEYSALLDGKQLEGSMIAKIGPDGGITREPMAKAIPDNVSGLIDLIFNPYNEFKGNLRGKLLEQFQTDLRNLKGGRGLPFFDVNTQGFIDKGVDALQFYYGGDGQNWKGFDHLYDGKPENMGARGQTLLGSFANSGFDEASAVNAAFGINNKFGPLPGRTFIQGRSIQKRANGGMIYAQNGQLVNFQPQGTDTVPAMLTPGEFVINRQATQANLPLLKAINSGESIVPSGFDIGGKVFDDMVTVTNKQSLNSQMNSLVENLKKYTSGALGHQKLVRAAQMGLGVTETGLGTDSELHGYGAYFQERGSRGSKISFSKERMRGATVRHEYAHAFANSRHDGLLKSFLNPGLLQEVNSSNYKDAGDSGYSIEDFARQPSELFATLASIQGGIGPKSQQFLRGSFKALGFENGGLVGSDGMSSLTGYNGKTIKAKLLSVNDRSAVINYQGKRFNVPLNKFDSDTRKALESKQSWSDHMSNTGDLGMSGRPSGPMLPVPKMFTNWHNNGNGNPRSIGSADGSMRKQGRILEVGPNGVIIESLGGSNRGQSGFVSFDALDSKTRGVAFELYESAKKHGRGQEIYSDHLRAESQKKLSKRVQKLFPGGVSKKMLSEMDNGHTDSELKSIVERLRREEDITAAGGREAYDRQQRTGTQTRHSENMMNDPTRNRLTPNSRKAGEEPTFGPSQNALDVKVAQSYIRQFKKTGRPISEFNAWADENKPGMAHSRRSLANTLLQQRGDELEQQIGLSSQDVGGSGRRETELSKSRAEQMQSKQDSALSKRTARMQATYDKMEKRYGPEKAAEMMEERGFKDGKIIPRSAPVSEADFQKKMVDRYWKQYSDSGSPLDPITWAKRNLPGLLMPHKESQLKAFVERSGHSYKSVLANPTQYTESRMPDNPDGTPGDMVMRVKNQTGLDGGKVNDPRGEGYSYQTERTHDSLNAQANEKGISRWQAGADLDRDREFADKNWVRSLAKYKELYKTKLRSTIESMPGVFDEYKYYTQEGAVRELSRAVMTSMEEQGIGNGAGRVVMPDINTAALSTEDWRAYNQDSNMRTYVESQVLKGWMQRKGQDDIDKADDIAQRLPEVAQKSKDAHDRTVAAAENVVNSRKAQIQTIDKQIAATEDSRGLTQSLLNEKKKQHAMERDHAEAVKQNLEQQINMIQNEEKIIKKQIEHHNKKPFRPPNAEGFAGGGIIKDVFASVVGNAASPVASKVGGAEAGAVVQGGQIAYGIGKKALQSGSRAAGRSGLAAFGAHVALDTILETGSAIRDPEAAAKRYDSNNRRQGQRTGVTGYLQNVGENLASPGRAIFQLGREAAGLVQDVGSALRPGYKAPEDRSPGRRAQRRQFGGVIYAANGMMIPRGTDTVPAMLTPGEFVVNRRAAQANMPLLNSINNGVQYLQNGGTVGGVSTVLDSFNSILSTVTQSVADFGAIMQQNAQGTAGGEAGGVNTNGIAAFTQNFNALLTKLEKINIPNEISATVNGTVNVNVAGGETFANLAQQSINSVVHQKLSAALDIVEKETEGQIKNPLK
jgi:TP901 family phage tail tape measure protein